MSLKSELRKRRNQTIKERQNEIQRKLETHRSETERQLIDEWMIRQLEKSADRGFRSHEFYIGRSVIPGDTLMEMDGSGPMYIGAGDLVSFAKRKHLKYRYVGTWGQTTSLEFAKEIEIIFDHRGVTYL